MANNGKRSSTVYPERTTKPPVATSSSVSTVDETETPHHQSHSNNTNATNNSYSNQSPILLPTSATCTCGHNLAFQYGDFESVAVLGDVPDQDCEAEWSNETTAKASPFSIMLLSTHKYRILTSLVLLALVAYIIADVICCNRVENLVQNSLDFVEREGVAGFFLFVFIFIIATIILFPPVILTYGAGLTFSMCYGIIGGTVVGTLAVLVGATIGSVIAFSLGRFVIKDIVSNWCRKYKLLRAIDVAVHRKGMKVSALLRLSPIIPFGVLNYIFAITRITFKDFVCGTLGIIPGTIAFVFFGALSGSAINTRSSSTDDSDDTKSTTLIILYVVGGAATLAAIFFVARVTKRILNETLEETAADAMTEINNSISELQVRDVCSVCAPFLNQFVVPSSSTSTPVIDEERTEASYVSAASPK